MKAHYWLAYIFLISLTGLATIGVIISNSSLNEKIEGVVVVWIIPAVLLVVLTARVTGNIKTIFDEPEGEPK